MCLMWELAKKEKSSYYFQEPLLSELKEKDFKIPEKFVGMEKFETFFEENRDVSEYIAGRFQSLLCSTGNVADTSSDLPVDAL